MRGELIEEMIKEVYGPREGSEEIMKELIDKKDIKPEADEFKNENPFDEYITGVIIPQKWKSKSEKGVQDPESEQLKITDTEGKEDESFEENITLEFPSELDPQMRSKSFGISFIVNTNCPSFKLCATWGMYEKTTEENVNIWKRNPYCETFDITLDSDGNYPPEWIYGNKDDGISLNIKKIYLNENSTHVTVTMVNHLDIKDNDDFNKLIAKSLYQPSIRINLNEGTELKPLTQIYEGEDKELHFIYRNRPVLARGHMCSAIWKKLDYVSEFESVVLWPDGDYFGKKTEKFKIPDIRSEFTPIYPMPSPSYDLPEEYQDGELTLSALDLSETWDQIDTTLFPLLDKYKSWISTNKSNISKYNKSEKAIAQNLIDKQDKAIYRMHNGIKILKENKDARLAFCFANKAIHTQSEWKKWVKDKKQVNKGKINEENKNKGFKWKPFQLAFLLMNIESIYDSESDDRDVLDLLWIPTGGGKTEAYLAIMAFTISLRRIKSLKGKSNGGGTSIISRYTLRLLTIQQFRRTLRMITAAEYLRINESNGKHGWRPKDCNMDNDWIYGSARFSVGMWVGSGVSPNHLRTYNGAIPALMGKKDTDGEPAQIIRCPVCDSWLALPESGLPKGDNEYHIVVNTKKELVEVNNSLSNIAKEFEFIEDFDIESKNHLEGNFTISFNFSDNKLIKETDMEAIFDYLWKEELYSSSLSYKRPGYFGSVKEVGRRGGKTINLGDYKVKMEYSDFEIWCPCPDCKLNNKKWVEGVPRLNKDINPDLPDGSMKRKIISPFLEDSRIPIPAYTVDEQIYFRCPTIVISTADKIARLAFEPRAASLFGNVNKYNNIYGFHRESLFPKEPDPDSEKLELDVETFLPPDLIVQDELHLIDGPLGSMFGLYEAMVDTIIKRANGNPKYIASTATIKNADNQAKLLFDKELFQFPPHGIDISNSFFIKEPFKSRWNEFKSGRVYMGIYTPGRGAMTPPIRIWSRLLKTSYDQFKQIKDNYPFWTLVGYFNAMRELANGRALYREDVEERLTDISEKDDERKLDQEKLIELSSRINSVKIPILLSELEKDGNNNPPNYDAIFTTSMFGTGIDIDHLSLMVVNGQPKTTGSYIQSTGRIGRDHGGLVITFLRAGKPRDLSHYEMFLTYHSRIHLGVEPVSVSPFSIGALERALGPAAISFFRNAIQTSVNWHEDNGKIISEKLCDTDIKYLRESIKSRLIRLKKTKKEISNILDYYDSEIHDWKCKALTINNGREFIFVEYANQWRDPKCNVVLGDPVHEHDPKLERVYKNAPQSLREIEETTGFWV